MHKLANECEVMAAGSEESDQPVDDNKTFHTITLDSPKETVTYQALKNESVSAGFGNDDDDNNYHQDTNVDYDEDQDDKNNNQTNLLVPGVRVVNDGTFIGKPKNGWWDHVISGCFRPILSFVVGDDRNADEQDTWEVPFEDLGDLKWLGSGSQGAVFRGMLRGQNVAVKKVRDEKDIEIKPLRKLQHPNIIRFL